MSETDGFNGGEAAPGEAGADALAAIAREAGIEAGDDLAAEVAALGRESAEPGAEGADEREGAERPAHGRTGAALQDALAGAGEEELAALPARTLESARAGLRDFKGEDLDRVGAMAAEADVLDGYFSTVAGLQDAVEAREAPAPMSHDPAARDWFEDDGSLTPAVRAFLGSDDPRAAAARSEWGSEAEGRLAAAVRIGLNDAVVHPALRAVFDAASWEDQAAAIRQLDAVAQRLKQRR